MAGGSLQAMSSTTSHKIRLMKKMRPSSARPGALTMKKLTTRSQWWCQTVSEEEGLAQHITAGIEGGEWGVED